VIIDAELMFSTGPCEFDTASWLRRADGSPSHSGKALAVEVCREVGTLPGSTLAAAIAVPDDVGVELRWPIAPKLHASVQFAHACLQAN